MKNVLKLAPGELRLPDCLKYQGKDKGQQGYQVKVGQCEDVLLYRDIIS